ncbi:MAG: hypothetical protein A2017_20740 [Lentisphaerae bacterium GWF2_44_16]|nr:MAG: hypothetical protein A2017_20740 [Lentisphaerae bacterium GWF2_44_16]
MNKNIGRNKTEYIADEIRSDILKRKYAGNEKLLSAVSLGKKYSVTKETVNMALSRLVTERLIYRKKGSGTYVSGPATKSKAIGVALNINRELSPSETPTAFAIFQGIISVAEYRGYHPVILSENSFSPEQLAGLNLSGLLLSTSFTSKFLELSLDLEKNKTPYLFIDRLSMDDDINYIEEYSSSEIYKAANYLIAQNHRRIACIGYNSEKLVYRNFFIGYEQAMREKGLFDPVLVKSVSGNSEDEMKNILKELMSLKEAPSAIFLFYRNAFENLYSALRHFNLKIPGDISIMSASHEPLRKDGLEITTIGTGKNNFGKAASNLLLDLIEGKIHSPVNRKLKLELREGNSVKKYEKA